MSVTTSTFTMKSQNKSKNVKHQVDQTTSITDNVQIMLGDLGTDYKTPSQVDISINNCRIILILNEMIDKVKIAINFKVLLDHKACKLRKCLPKNEVEYIQMVCAKHYKGSIPGELRHKSFAENVSNIINRISKSETIKWNSFTDDLQYNIDHLLDPNIIKAMEMVYNNELLRSKTLTDWDRAREPVSVSFLSYSKKLRDIMKDRLSLTAFEEKSRENSLRRAFKSNKTLLNKIKLTKEELDINRKFYETELSKKKSVIDQYLKNISNFKETYTNKIKMRVASSESDMYNSSGQSSNLQAQLTEETNLTVTTYENLLAQHIKLEKELRKSRLKVETQLASWLTKYDTDVGERQATYEQVLEGYEAEKVEFDELTEKFNEQNEEYEPLMEEKREEEQRIFEEKWYQFFGTRAAIKIQRWWRAYKARMKALKKAKKGKKGKKGKGKKKSKKEKGKKENLEPDAKVADLNEKLGKEFGGDVFEDLGGPGFDATPIEVDITDPDA